MTFVQDLLAGKQLLVTGASSGLGRDFAIEAARHGARIHAVGRNRDALDQTLRDCPGECHRAHPHEIESIDDFGAFVQEIGKQHGPLYGAFHSAGLHILESVRRGCERSRGHVFDAAFGGTVGLITACSRKAVMEDGGRIVVMSSVSGDRPVPGLAMYGASKAAIRHYAQTAASELAKRSITINTIAAANVVTEMHRRTVDIASTETREQLENDHPLGFGEPADVSAAVLFLMSPGARWITGADLVVDGGYLAR